jgi:prolyl 4-hydroxylase
MAHALTHVARRRFCRNSEDIQLVRYAEGQYFGPHTDYFKPTDKNVDDAGQRLFTGLAYLNDDFEGGETVFNLLNLTIRPRRGRMVFWRNLDFAARPDPRTVHRADPVRAGRKLACNMWVLERRFQR